MSRNASSTIAAPRHKLRLLAKRSIIVLLVGSLSLATIAISGANGMLGQQWKRYSLRAWHQANLAAQLVSNLPSEHQDALLPIRLIRFFRSTSQHTAPAESATTSSTRVRTASSAPITSAAVPGQPMVTGGRQLTYSRPVPPATYQLPITLPYVDRSSEAYARFKSRVDASVSSTRSDFTAIEAAIMYQLSPEAKYCNLAINLVEQQVSSAESAIAAGTRPVVSNDSYLYVGPLISELAMTLRTCSASIGSSQRQRWSAYAEQTVWNIWNFSNAQWGGRSFPWSGWSTDNPGNNYYYSFIEATMYWALASGNATWINELRDRRLPALQAYFAKLPGGGSSEGTGYGTSHMRLFSIYHLWYAATGIDLANSSSHATDSIYYWIHATVPTMDRYAPIGDQARNSIPELYDYHRRLVLEARFNSNRQAAQNAATWWLSNISVPRMSSGFNFRHDLLPAGTTQTQPTDLTYYAPGVGHLFSRTGWDRNAMWVAIVAGPYNESHAGQDQGSFTLFSQDWLAVTANIWSHSGINQGTDVHNLVRFVRNGAVVRQCPSTTRISTIAVTPAGGGAFTADANLTPAFCDNSAVTSWQRRFEFGNRKLTVRDTFAMTAGTSATFQVNVPVAPTLVNSREAVAGRLRVRVLQPANATISSNFSSGKYTDGDGAGFRIDVQNGTTGYVVELTEI